MYRDKYSNNSVIEKNGADMDADLILRIIGIGLIVSVAYQILSKSGRDEQAMFVTIAGIIVVLVMITSEIAGLLNTIKDLFGI